MGGDVQQRRRNSHAMWAAGRTLATRAAATSILAEALPWRGGPTWVSSSRLGWIAAMRRACSSGTPTVEASSSRRDLEGERGGGARAAGEVADGGGALGS